MCGAIFLGGCNMSRPSAKQPQKTNGNLISNKANKSLKDPIEYVLEKLKDHDLVMIGERHWTHEEPVFIQNLIQRCLEKRMIKVVFIEFGGFEDQWRIDTFMESPQYDPKPIVDVLRNSYELGWGYQEYFDILKLIYDENRKRPSSERVKLVLVDSPSSLASLEKQLYECVARSPVPENQKWQMVSWLRESFTDRDHFMADVIEMYSQSLGPVRAIYYAGSSHIRKDLRIKDYGRRFFSAGGILARKYPGRVCSLTFHMEPRFWQNANDFDYIEELFEKGGKKSFGIDTNDSRIVQLKLKSNIFKTGVALKEAFDGYIMLNQNKDYHPCDIVPGFYDDEFAKIIWDKLKKEGRLKHLPPEFQEWQNKTPTGSDLEKMIKEGLH